jgi:eukaryotic-like serine/threonine-protein kinase
MSARNRPLAKRTPDVPPQSGPTPVMPPRSDAPTEVDGLGRLAPGTLVGGRYRILSLRGVGGMGVVYHAHDEELDSDVALKLLRSDLSESPRSIDRFRREILLARQVSHRNVVRFHDIGESGGLRFLTMGYVEGESLYEVLDRRGRLPVDRAVVIARQVADALQSAHDVGIVHRDLKPSNVLLAPDGTAYITDFGLAQSVDRDRLTRAGAVVGTPDYLSPEQIRGDPVDGRSDIYALGIIFYEMLTGQLPFSGETRAERVAQRLTGRIAHDVKRGLETARTPVDTGPPRSDVPIPSHVQCAVRRCLEVSPRRRYQSARDLVIDLDRGEARPSNHRALRVAVVCGLAVAAGLIGWLAMTKLPAWRESVAPAATHRVDAAATSVRHSLAVLPLDDAPGDPSIAWTGSGVAEMLAASLSESPDLRVVDARRVFRTLDDLKLDTGRYDDQALKQLASLLNVDTLVTGRMLRAGSGVRIDLQLVQADGGSASTRRVMAEASGTTGVFDVIDQLSSRLRSELDASRPIQADATRLHTSSAEATTAYLEGRGKLLRGDYVGAAPAFERATKADPAFVEALERLSETYQQLGYQDKALTAARRASERLGTRGDSRLGRRVRARLAMLRGEPAQAETLYAALAKQYLNDVESFLDLASAQSAQGHLPAAVTTLERVTSLDQKDPRAWFLLGKHTILMGASRKAVDDYLARALALQNQLGNRQGQGDVANAMGVAYHELGTYPQAVEQFTTAAERRRQARDDRGLATTLRNRARSFNALGRGSEAESDLATARTIHERIGDRQGLADVINEAGLLHESRGDYGQALRSYQEALRIRRSLGDERLLAQSYDNVGYIQYLQGEYDDTLVYWKGALDLRRRIGDKSGLVLSTQNMGFLHTAQGRWTEAVKAFLDALEQARALDSKTAMAVSHGNLGVLHAYQGRLAAALDSFTEARRLLEAQHDTRGLAEFTLKEAGALLDIGALEPAKKRLDAAALLVKQTGNREQLADYHLLLAEWQRSRGERDTALRAVAEARPHAEASRSRTTMLHARLADASLRAERGESGAVRTLATLERDADALGHAPLRLSVGEALARAQLVVKRPADAELATRQALAVAERAGWRAGCYRLHELLGRALAARGDAAAATREYGESAREVAQLRDGIPPDLRAAFDELPTVRAIEARVRAQDHR